MNLLEEKSLQPGDNLDNLLRAFYQAEMPNPWPSLEAPARPARKGRRTLLRSRLALAASVALLISGLLFLADRLRDASGAGTVITPDKVIGDRAEKPDELPRNNGQKPRSRSSEGLIQKSDGTYIQIDIFELPASK
jgi:hypothetical protein